MKERPFGATGLFVAEIGMGCSLLGRRRMLRADREWVRLLHRAFELGINFYDTADSYQDGLSEELIGRAFRDRRSRVIIASKVGYRTSTLTKLAKRLAGVLPYGYAVVRSSSNDLPTTLTRQRQDFSPDHIQEAIEGSLKASGQTT